ncbi:cation:proton antiporter [Candidatus Woesearchaeota archaeon]|nr:cation:proton antiporter [Candidatus Woesearchaeota archaeon]
MNLLITIIIILILSFLALYISKKTKISGMVSLIFVGIILGTDHLRYLIMEPNTQTIIILGDIGLIGLMFFAGLNSSLRRFYSERHDATSIGIFSLLVPFIIGFFVFHILGFSIIISVVVGICLSMTAEAEKAKELMEVGKIKTRVGTAILESGMIDNILGILIFMLTAYSFSVNTFGQFSLLTSAIISFFVGLFLQDYLVDNKKSLNIIRNMLQYIFIPFFFISMGIFFDISYLAIEPEIIIMIIFIGVVSKLIGAFLAKINTNFTWKQLNLIGWAMNSRGSTELAIALVAFRAGLIPDYLFSALILLAIISTVWFPFILREILIKNPKIMN